MKKVIIAILALALLLAASTVAPVAAIGPTRAAEVGKNPNVFINPVNQKTALNTPNGDKSGLDRNTWYHETIFLYLNVSNVNGITNNAAIADIDTVKGMVNSPEDYENKWIYLSGEDSDILYDDPADDPLIGSHGMFYWWIRLGSGFSHEQALASIEARNPEGGLVKLNFVGQ